MLEVQNRGPVVAEVLCHFAGGAGSLLTHITVHGSVERISTNNVMDMSGRTISRLDNGVKTLGSQRGAPEAETCLYRHDGRDEREDGESLHLNNNPVGLKKLQKLDDAKGAAWLPHVPYTFFSPFHHRPKVQTSMVIATPPTALFSINKAPNIK